MNPVPAAVNAPRTPTVNLLPPEIEQRRAKKRARNLILLGMVAFFLLVVGAWFYAYSAHQSAEAELAAEQDKTAEKQAELASYSYIPLIEEQLANSVNARAWVGQTDVEWSTQLDALFSALPKDVRLTSVIVTGASPVSPVLSDGTPLAMADLGSVAFAGTSKKPINVPDFQDAVEALPGFSMVSIQVIKVEGADDGETAFWSYAGTARITPNALSGRVETTQEVVPLDENGQPVTAEDEG